MRHARSSARSRASSRRHATSWRSSASAPPPRAAAELRIEELDGRIAAQTQMAVASAEELALAREQLQAVETQLEERNAAAATADADLATRT